MRTTDAWKDYQIIDASGGEKLERWGDVLLIRPDPQIIWHTDKKDLAWSRAAGRYVRSNRGGGAWEFFRQPPKQWEITYRDLRFHIKPTGFKHMGLFPEQAVNWDWFRRKIIKAKRPIRVLNLFAYTGGATLACAAAGAEVCHVDASKGTVLWAKENAALSELSEGRIRYIVDDCEKFVEREIRRAHFYDAVIMDPPSYGRGPGGEVWKLEQKLYHLLLLCRGVLGDKPLFFVLNSYTTGLSPSVMAYLLGSTVGQQFGGHISADEIGLAVQNGRQILPCGATAVWTESDTE